MNDRVMSNESSWSELRKAWPILFGATLGMSLSSSALLYYTAGLFVGELEREIGLTRTQFGFSILCANLLQSLAAPFVGAVIDRIGIRWPIMISALMVSFSFLAMSVFVQSVALYVSFQVMVAVLGTGTSPLSFTRGVTGWFFRMRGLALGITLSGMGASAAITPIFVAHAIEDSGWRGGYRLLAALALLVIPIVLILLRKVDAPAEARSSEHPVTGIGIADALRSRAFLLLALGFGLQSLSFAGMAAHFVPLLTDSGVTPVVAAQLASVMGVAIVGSRLVIGWLTDRLFAPWVAAGVCLVCAAGCTALLVNPAGFAVLGALALGCALGAEVDLIAYCVARYFGLISYGRLYGILYGVFITSAGLSPLWIGMFRDTFGSYYWSLWLCVIGLGMAASLLIFAPSYPRHGDGKI